MSLFDAVTNQQASNPVNTVGTQSSGTGSLLGNAVTQYAFNTAKGLAMSNYNKAVNPQTRQLIDKGLGAAANLANGNFQALGLQALSFLPGGANAAYMATPTPLFGGISPQEALQIYEQMQAIPRSHKNLWLLQVKSNLMGDITDTINMFASEVEYAPFTVEGDKLKIASAVMDRVEGCTATEMQITCTDDAMGTVKQWFQAHAAACVHQDGTVGVPADYAILISIYHNLITEDSINYAEAAGSTPFKNIGWFRTANVSLGLSRREQGLEELQMTFTQLDTFISPPGA